MRNNCSPCTRKLKLSGCVPQAHSNGTNAKQLTRTNGTNAKPSSSLKQTVQSIARKK